MFQASFFIKQILLGVQHLHNHNVAHLDLKVIPTNHPFTITGPPTILIFLAFTLILPSIQPENVMLLGDNSRIIKLIDFGLSRKILPGTEVSILVY